MVCYHTNFTVVVQSLICVRLFETWWTAEHQASLLSTVSEFAQTHTSIESVMTPNHLSHPLLPPSPGQILVESMTWAIWGINRVGFDSVNYNCVRCSVISNSLWPPLTVACQAPLSAEFSRQEYWNGLLLPTPGDLPDLGIEPTSPALQADSLPYELPGNPRILL